MTRLGTKVFVALVLAFTAAGCGSSTVGAGESDVVVDTAGETPEVQATPLTVLAAPPNFLPNPDGTPAPGRWRKAPAPARTADTAIQDEIEALEALGYLGGVTPAPDFTGVSVYKADDVWPGYNFYASGHAAGAVLMSMEGRVLHTWEKSFEEVWPERQATHNAKAFWTRAHLYENGDVLAIYSGFGIARFDKDSNILWKSSNRAHHDLQMMEDGSFYTLTNEARIIPELSEAQPVLEDFIVHMSPEGEELRSVSLYDCFKDSDYYELLTGLPTSELRDLFHTNSIERIDAETASLYDWIEEGFFLLSIRNRHLLAIVDIDAEQVVWATAGPWKRQHFAKFLADGQILFFDNRGTEGYSRIYELDPGSNELVWTYEGSESSPFYSKTSGFCFRLPNGNTLISETDNGRAFEISPEHEIVWEFWNPERAGDNNEYIACILAMTRIAPEYTVSWLEADLGH